MRGSDRERQKETEKGTKIQRKKEEAFHAPICFDVRFNAQSFHLIAGLGNLFSAACSARAGMLPSEKWLSRIASFRAAQERDMLLRKTPMCTPHA